MTTASQDAAVSPDCLIEGYQDRLDELRGVSARSPDTAIGSSISRVIANAANAYRTGILPGLQTGIRLLDDKLQPMRGGQLIVAGGANGHGKSVLAATILLNNALKGVPSLLLSLEMKGDDFAQRLLAGESGIDAGRIIGGALSEDEFRLLQEIEQSAKQWPLAVETPKRLTDTLLVRIARQYIRKRGIKILGIDHIGLMHGRGRSNYEQMSDITRGLKEAALELDIPILALAQLNRDPQRRGDAKDWSYRYQRRRPKKSDLRDSGSIEQDADVVLLLHREEEACRRHALCRSASGKQHHQSDSYDRVCPNPHPSTSSKRRIDWERAPVIMKVEVGARVREFTSVRALADPRAHSPVHSRTRPHSGKRRPRCPELSNPPARPCRSFF
jgi:replicative DNA helicase